MIINTIEKVYGSKNPLVIIGRPWGAVLNPVTISAVTLIVRRIIIIENEIKCHQKETELITCRKTISKEEGDLCNDADDYSKL